MKDEAKTSLRLYLDSAHIEAPTSLREQRFGSSLVFKSALPFVSTSVAKRLSYGLQIQADPDVKKKSADVNILQHFYAMYAFLEVNYVYLLRFSALFGPGLLASVTRYNILDTKDSHTHLSAMSQVGVGVDYAIDSRWELGWHLLFQYHVDSQKLDWRQGFGINFNL
jgi:hypothetical protein